MKWFSRELGRSTLDFEGKSIKLLFASAPILLTAFLIGCLTSYPGAETQVARPDDFAVEYEWREGTLPPPYHYEYLITLKSSGQAEIVLIPDYPSQGVPKWVEHFNLKAQTLDDLYRLMHENGLSTQMWRRLDPPIVGGSIQTMVVTVQGKRITVEDYLVPEQQAPAHAMYAGVKAVVPKEIWERLQARRERYVQEHPRK